MLLLIKAQAGIRLDRSPPRIATLILTPAAVCHVTLDLTTIPRAFGVSPTAEKRTIEGRFIDFLLL